MATKSTKVLQADNQAIMRAIWNDASMEYQNRIPNADQGDITDTIQRLFSSEYRPQLNEFVDALVNRIGSVVFRNKTWTNPLGIFKRGMMEFGDTVEEIAYGIIKAKRYDANNCETDVFACSPPPIYANYHQINRQDRYDLTINRQMLRRAMIDNNGLQAFIDDALTIPYNSDEFDEYLIMKNLLREYAREDGFYKVQVPDVINAEASEQEGIAKQITSKIRGFVGRLKFFSGAYNPSGVPTFSRNDELVVIGLPEFLAILDVNVIAQAFNVSAADLTVRFIEVDDLGIDGAQAILCDENFFLCMDTLIEFADIYNPKALNWNYFLHHHGLYSVSRFVNAILFTTEAGTISTVPTITLTSVSVSPEAVNGVTPEFAPLGGSTRMLATVAGSVSPTTAGVEVPQAVVWSISGTTGKPLSQRTYIDAEGVLHVAEDEQNTAVDITATTTYLDPTKPISEQTALTDTLTFGVGAKYTPTPAEPESTK